MPDEQLTRNLKRMLAECEMSRRVFETEQAHFRRIAREQNIQLAVGRVKIDAARAGLEARLAARGARKESQ